MKKALKVIVCPVTAFAQNCSLLICEQTNQAALIDPGGDAERLIELIDTEQCQLTHIYLTHGHLDHVGATHQLAQHYHVKISGPHQADAFWLDALPKQSEMFNFDYAEPFSPNRWLENGDEITIGKHTLEVRFTPGHTPGHVVFVDHQAKKVFVGDVIFKGSVGRTDFPMGNATQLNESIVTQIYSLGDDYVIYPGHGPTTQVGYERATNPFTSSRFG